MRIAVGLVLGLVSILLALVFVIVAVTKMESGAWVSYLTIAVYGLGATGCALSARRRLRPERRSLLSARPGVGVALGLAAIALAILAVRSAGFAASSRGSLTADPRQAVLIIVLLDGLGAAGSFAAARQCFAHGDLGDSGVGTTVVR
jgi:hypothetical protein